MNKRSLTELELEIIKTLLSVDFQGRNELLKQLDNCMAMPTEDTDNYGSIYLYPVGPSANVERSVPVDGIVKDSDGEDVNLLLHVKNGMLDELEVVKLDGTNLMSSIDAENIEVILNNS